MSNDNRLDEVRARIRRAQEQEAAALSSHPGIQEVKAAGDRRRQEDRREEAQREAAREQARREGREAEMESLKAELRNSYLGAGGSPEEYEKAWPGLRDQELARRTLERAMKARRQTEANYRETF